MSDIERLAQYVGGLSRKIDYLMTIEKGTATGGGGGGGTAVFNDAEGDPANVALAAADGGSNYAARRDHRHALPGTVVQALGTAYFAGTAEVTAGTILAKLLTVDGAGSGLDADFLDGFHASAFSGTAHTHTQYAGTAEVTPGTILAKLLTVDGSGTGLDADTLDGSHGTAFASAGHTHSQYAGTAEVTPGTILAKLLTVDGAGSGLDADTLDGAHLTAIMGSVALAGMDINGLTLGTVQAGDTIPFYDSGLGSVVKSDYLNFFSQFFNNAPATSIEGQNVRYIQWNSVTGSAQYITRSQLLHTTGLSPLGTATIDPGNDLLFFTDVSAGTIPKVVSVEDFLSYGGGLDFDDITSLVPSAPDSLDEIAIYSLADGEARKTTVEDILALGGGAFDWDSLDALDEGIDTLNISVDYLPVYVDSEGRTVKRSVWEVASNGVTALDVLNKIKTMDGTGSGLDADTVDGSHAADFAPVSHSHDASDIDSGTLDDARIPSGITRDSEVMSIVLANDGSGSGLDADTLDGLTSTQFARMSGISTTNNLGGTITIQQLPLSIISVPANGYVTLPNEARFLLAHRTGGANAAFCLLHLGTGGNIVTIGANSVQTTNTGNDCVYWDAGSSTYRIGNNAGNTRSWRILLIRG